MRGRRPGDALDVVGPKHGVAGALFRQVPRDVGGLAQISADPTRAVHAAGDNGAVLVDDLHHAAVGEVAQPQPILEMFELNTDAHDCGELPGPVFDRPRQGSHPFAGGASADRLADRKPLTAQHGLEIVTVSIVGAAVFRRFERRPNVVAVRRRQQNVAHVSRQLGLDLPQDLVVR